MSVDPQVKPIDGGPGLSSPSSLAVFYADEFARIRRVFETSGDGRAAACQRAALVDGVLVQLYQEFVSHEAGEPQNLCLTALGGYGRSELFPYSDIDLVFICSDQRVATRHRQAIAAVSRALWDLRFRVGCAVRTLAECGRLHRDNLEFSIALLDSRYLAGDPRLFGRLRDRAIPHFAARERRELRRNLVEMTRRRHQKYGNTIFHLEPNIKETPGGLRDYQVARWLTLVRELGTSGRWLPPEEVWSGALQAPSRDALNYLSAARCFLHFVQARDDNHLTYELQERAAVSGIAHAPGERPDAAEWMRHYFRHARTIDQLVTQVLHDGPSKSSFYAVLRHRKSRLSDADFLVARDRISPRRPEAVLSDPTLLLRAFEFMARHGLDLSREAEDWVQQSLPSIAPVAPRHPGMWKVFRQILLLPHTAEALRAMHRLGLLTALFPEFRAIDSLVVRDFYHRYTVDEHSLMTIQNLKTLRAAPPPRNSPDAREANFAEILGELEQPELLFLALLFHDVGKGMRGSNHIVAGLEALEAVLERLELEAEERDVVRFLVVQHLEMSATLQRRDIFDPETVHAFAERVGTLDRLKMLCLLTYADIKSVNPEALTPWKAEMLWQLFLETANYLTRSLDDERLHITRVGLTQVEGILPLVLPPTTQQELSAFLEGFPKRYLAAHSREEIARHFELARRLAQNPVQVSLRPRNRLFELTVLTADRPRLFASITGTLAAWGMNIVKADAFANSRRTILDTFRFEDLFRTIELNPSESERFKQSLAAVLRGELDLERLMSARVSRRSFPRPKVKIETEIRFDDSSSTHSTLLELITQDHPGLLYQVSSTLAGLKCNIEVALIDTEGEKVIDVFYLTCAGAKLDPVKQEEIRRALLPALRAG